MRPSPWRNNSWPWSSSRYDPGFPAGSRRFESSLTRRGDRHRSLRGLARSLLTRQALEPHCRLWRVASAVRGEITRVAAFKTAA